jgi:hypothetical protein
MARRKPAPWVHQDMAATILAALRRHPGLHHLQLRWLLQGDEVYADRPAFTASPFWGCVPAGADQGLAIQATLDAMNAAHEVHCVYGWYAGALVTAASARR